MTRWALCFLPFASLLAAGSASAAGWQEMHQTSDDVRIVVAEDGVATVQHHLRFRIVAGKWKSFDVVGIDPAAEISNEATVTTEKGNVDVSAHAEVNPKKPDTLKIVFDERAKGLSRGIYLALVSYRIDLVKTKMLTRDGAMWKVAWTAPPSPQGTDGARVTFELPQAPTEPRIAKTDGPATTIATLRRLPDRDELELVRAHVPRGEAAGWAVRVDPKALPKVTGPELRPAAAAAAFERPPEQQRWGIAIVTLVFVVAAGLLALLFRAKIAAVRAACAPIDAVPRLLVPVPLGLSPLAYGASVSGAVAALLGGEPIAGALLVAAALALGAHRAPGLRQKPRGPGIWKVVDDGTVLLPRALERMPGDLFDLGTWTGRALAATVAITIGVGSHLLRLRVAGIGVALPLGALGLVPLFLTGTRAQLPEKPEALAARVLRPARDALARTIDLAHVDVATVARCIAKDVIDEVRLSCAPAVRTPGLRAIELALAVGSRAALPEILVRFDDASEAAARIATIAPGTSIVPGRSPEEKVLRVAPEDATPEGAARVIAALLGDLEERRANDPRCVRYAGVERRVVCPLISAAAS